MFVTSATGDADLGSWPDAGGETGIAAADAICQSLATAATLDNPDGFRAWISDSVDDAYCRVLGLSGKKADNCGAPALPDGGPWLRTDGFPFSGTLQQLTSESMVLVPPWIDETGIRAEINPDETLTGTYEDGSWAGLDCKGWTDTASGRRYRGQNDQTVRDWAAQGSSQCFRGGRLLCFEADATPDALPGFEQPGALVFVTSVRRFGNLGAWPEAEGRTGLKAGDRICQTLAQDAGLPAPGSFLAWLSNNNISAEDRFTFPGPWKRVDGVPVAADVAELLDDYLFTSISVTENGDYVLGRAWTGWKSNWNCANWSDDAAQGIYGIANDAGFRWRGGQGGPCDNFPSRLYCFSQVPAGPGEIFADGFESGDTSAWSGTLP